ncbi:MAG: imidazoleglycerol-phosphate dehydratase HisB [Candidatus Omnitrophica bacterium]|nr:imidazoleglycerol-phosphate dehydratase HisB [Candidatus Omnitrophota bacterium]
MRKAIINRKTKETTILAKLNIDGSGKSKINTGIGILDHMLELFAFWGFFDLELIAKGDLNIDLHHTNEDIGIVLGEAFKQALGDKKGIRRFGSASVPMEEVIAYVILDISGRGHLQLKTSKKITSLKKDKYQFSDIRHFFDSFAKHLGMNLNINIENPVSDLHTTLEPVFKALGIALDQATQVDPRRKGIPSTKGIID